MSGPSVVRKGRALQPEMTRRDALAMFVAGVLAPSAVEAAPPPVVVWVRVLDPSKAMQHRVGGALTTIISLSPFDVENLVLVGAAAETRREFADRGIAAAVTQMVISPGEITRWAVWAPHLGRKGGWEIYSEPASSFRVMRIEVLDPIAAARAQSGMVGLGRALGVRVSDRVWSTTAELTAQAMSAGHAAAAIGVF